MHLTADDHPHSIKAYLGAVFFYIGFILSVFIYSCVVLLASPFLPIKSRFPIMAHWAVFITAWLRITCGVTYKIMGHIPKGPAVILSKHQSQWETFYFQALFPPQITVLKHSLIQIPIFGWALNKMEPIVIDRSQRSTALQQIIDQGTKRLKEGCRILIFPEGTRIRSGKNSTLSRGGFVLAKESGFPIVPVAHNAGEFWHPDYLTKKPGEITIVIGEPIETQSRSIEELMEAVREWMQNKMYEISTVEKQAQSKIQLPEVITMNKNY